jgi:putative ABC transport system permease protein
VRLMLSGGLRLIGAGVLAGLLAAVAGARVLTTLIFGVRATDPLTLGSAVALLVAVGLVAHAVPLRRALRIDPASALRAE